MKNKVGTMLVINCAVSLLIAGLVLLNPFSFGPLSLVCLNFTIILCNKNVSIFKDIGRYVLAINFISVVYAVTLVLCSLFGKKQIYFFVPLICCVLLYYLIYITIMRQEEVKDK